ncbi:hypothetical protein MMC26_002894 [Xylographa opegraphella]|nr:hypothetical protein [Xylographa opegraphella]
MSIPDDPKFELLDEAGNNAKRVASTRAYWPFQHVFFQVLELLSTSCCRSIDTRFKKMVEWKTISSLLLTLGPLFVPRLYSYYKTSRVQAQTSNVPVRPVPRHVQYAINILLLAAALAIVATFPQFQPENLFTLTSSRLHTPIDVLFTRLTALRPEKQLTDFDNELRSRLAALDARCLYFAYGPAALAECPFCKSDDPATFFYYSLPARLFLHLLNLFALGLATSTALSGKEGGRWRTMAALVGSCLAIADCYMVGAYDWKGNSRATRAEDLDFFYWRMRTIRGLAIAALDAGLAGLIWASSTNRLFVVPLSSAERLESITKVMEATRGKLGAVGMIRNVTVRDENLRKKAEIYWKREGEIMGEVMDEKEVVEGIRGALESGRMNVTTIEEEAKRYAESIFVAPDEFPTG